MKITYKNKGEINKFNLHDYWLESIYYDNENDVMFAKVRVACYENFTIKFCKPKLFNVQSFKFYYGFYEQINGWYCLDEELSKLYDEYDELRENNINLYEMVGSEFFFVSGDKIYILCEEIIIDDALKCFEYNG